MNSTSENRKTRIDFKRLGYISPIKTKIHNQATQKLIGKEHNLANRTNPLQDTTAIKKGSLSPNESVLKKRVNVKPLSLPEIIRTGLRAPEPEPEHVKSRHSSPWDSYKKLFDIQLGEDNVFVTVAERKDAQDSAPTRDTLSDLALVRTFSGPWAEDELLELQHIRDTNMVSLHEVFSFEGNYYVAFEYMAYSLYYVAGNPLLDEIRLAAIVGQVRRLSGLTINRDANYDRYSMLSKISCQKV